MDLTENALKILKKRYLKHYNNKQESAEDMFQRVAFAIATGDKNFGKTDSQIKKLANKFYKLMTNLYFLPNSPTLMNAGTELGQLAACFVLPINDTLEDIFETIKNTAIIHKTGGGTGFSFSRLRAKNSIVHSTMGVSSGPVSFMEVFNAATEAVKQGGTRRGANMGILRVDHPDIVEFIKCKENNNKLNNFNISVALSNRFMQAVIQNKDYELINPQDKSLAKKLSANKIFDLIVECAWKNGEPGVIFIDKINENNPTPQIGEIESTNPCGEVPLLPYEACNLGSINLSLMVKDKTIDWELLKDTVKTSIHFLDNVIEVNKYPLKQISELVKNNRKIGLGVMGWADMLMKLEIPYNSEDAVNLASEIMEFIDYISKVQSVELAKERGKFNNFEGSVYSRKNYLYNRYKEKSAGKITDNMWLELDKEIEKYGIRNATTTCIAPTGTISMIAGVSCGIEPLFGLVFSRFILDGVNMLEINPIFKNYMISKDLYNEDLMKKIANTGSVSNIKDIPSNVKQIFTTAHDVSPYWHIKMQAAFQKHTDNAVSKTVNFVETATKEDIKNTFLMAYENNLKGITVYRDNSRQFQPMNLKETSPKIQNNKGNSNQITIKIMNCPQCGNKIEMAEGCYICTNCGYSGCS